MPKMTTTQPPPEPPTSPTPRCRWLVFNGFLGVSPECGKLFCLSLFFVFFFFFFFFFFCLLSLSLSEETNLIKIRLTGTHTLSHAPAGRKGSLVSRPRCRFSFVFPVFSPFYVCASSAAFWLKERFGESRLGCPLSSFFLGLTFLLRPLGFSENSGFTPHSGGPCRCLHRAEPRDVRARPSAE